MAPPTVSLSKKEPLDLVFDTSLPEKEDGTELPSVISIDTEQRARNFRQLKSKKRCRRIAGALVILIFLAVAGILTFTLVKVLYKHRQHSWTVPDKQGQTMDVHADADNNLIHAKHNTDNRNKSHPGYVEIMHDYSRRFVAYKYTVNSGVQNSTCYLDRLDESFQVGYERWQGYETSGRNTKALKVISQPIEVQVLKHIANLHIYAHCISATSYWVMEIEEKDVTTEMTVVYI